MKKKSVQFVVKLLKSIKMIVMWITYDVVDEFPHILPLQPFSLILYSCFRTKKTLSRDCPRVYSKHKAFHCQVESCVCFCLCIDHWWNTKWLERSGDIRNHMTNNADISSQTRHARLDLCIRGSSMRLISVSLQTNSTSRWFIL